jgi:hypothetical protein
MTGEGEEHRVHIGYLPNGNKDLGFSVPVAANFNRTTTTATVAYGASLNCRVSP